VVGSSLESIYLSDIDGDRDIAPPPDTTLETECVETACTGTVGSLPADCSTVLNGLSVGPKLTTIGPYSIPGDVTINIGYKLTSSLKGWFTVRDGDIYSGSSFIMVPPQEPGSYDLYLTNSFALSSGTLDIKDSGGVERISDKGYGYAIDPINLAVQASDLPANVTKKPFFRALDPSESLLHKLFKFKISPFSR